MKKIDWNNVQEVSDRPTPGGYAAKIISVDDVESKEYLRICWDFADGEFKGDNQRCFDSYGFYPMSFVRSYKEKALPFFKAFKTAVEKSNPGFEFKDDPQSLVGKYVGVVLGEEEYQKRDGSYGTRLYVSEARSGEAIRKGDFKIPEFKRLPDSQKAALPDFEALGASEDDLPF